MVFLVQSVVCWDAASAGRDLKDGGAQGGVDCVGVACGVGNKLTLRFSDDSAKVSNISMRVGEGTHSLSPLMPAWRMRRARSCTVR